MSTAFIDTVSVGDALYAPPPPPPRKPAPPAPPITPGERYLFRVLALLVLSAAVGFAGFKAGEAKSRGVRPHVAPHAPRCPYECRWCRRHDGDTGDDRIAPGASAAAK